MRRVLETLQTMWGGPQSALEPAGLEAERIAALFWSMTLGGLLVWLAVISLAFYAARLRATDNSAHIVRFFIIGCGVVVPTITLTTLLLYGLAPIPELLEPAPPGSLQIHVSGEQWWWRVRYEVPGGDPIQLANEIHLPVGEPVQFILDSPDVIHSFWVPSLGGKMDMIPGRTTRLKLTPSKTGIYRGACGEYCGTSHALMSFRVVVEERSAFEQWLAKQAQPAGLPAESTAQAGQELFVYNGCGACHAIRGTAADGVIGPDLTHVGSRLSLAADVLPNDLPSYEKWIFSSPAVKPGSLMPPFHMLPPGNIPSIAAYLEQLQ